MEHYFVHLQRPGCLNWAHRYLDYSWSLISILIIYINFITIVFVKLCRPLPRQMRNTTLHSKSDIGSLTILTSIWNHLIHLSRFHLKTNTSHRIANLFYGTKMTNLCVYSVLTKFIGFLMNDKFIFNGNRMCIFLLICELILFQVFLVSNLIPRAKCYIEMLLLGKIIVELI